MRKALHATLEQKGKVIVMAQRVIFTVFWSCCGVFVFIFSMIPAVQSNDTDASEVEVIALEQQVEAAYLNSDTDFLEETLRRDFRFTHSNGRVEGRGETLTKFAKAGNFISRDLTSVDAEIHDNVALTSGRIEVVSSGSNEYTICYIRLYMRNDKKNWQLVSHRSYKGAKGHDEACNS